MTSVLNHVSSRLRRECGINPQTNVFAGKAMAATKPDHSSLSPRRRSPMITPPCKAGEPHDPEGLSRSQPELYIVDGDIRHDNCFMWESLTYWCAGSQV